MSIKAITLHQPWATLVTLGAKKIETRSWPTKYRGTLAIHASRAFPARHEALCRNPRYLAALRPELQLTGHDRDEKFDWRHILPFGQVVGHVDLVDCKPTRELRAVLNTDDDEWAFGDFSDGPDGSGRYGFILENPRHYGIGPIPALGHLGIWDWDGEPYHGRCGARG